MKPVLLVANPRAGSIAGEDRQEIETRLAGKVDLEVAQTEGPRHATELARDAVERGCEAVLALGGDGTVHEVAQGLVGTKVALGILPAGTANVIARGLGVPNHAVEASDFAAERLAAQRQRQINVGQIDGRYFLANTGMGLDAEVVKRVQENPEAKQKWGEWLFLVHGLRAAFSDYRVADPAITLRVDEEEPVRIVLAICCNLYPYTYLKRWPVDACPRTRLDGGLDFLGLRELPVTAIPRIFYSLFRSRSHVDWSITSYNHDARAGELLADRPMPVQVDGEFFGDVDQVTIRLVPDALRVLL